MQTASHSVSQPFSSHQGGAWLPAGRAVVPLPSPHPLTVQVTVFPKILEGVCVCVCDRERAREGVGWGWGGLIE